MLLSTDGMPEYDMQEGFGDSDEVLGLTTGLELNLVSFNNNSGGNYNKGKGTNVGDKTSSSGRTISSLRVRRRGDAMKKKGSSLEKIVYALNRIADANDIDAERARADRMIAYANDIDAERARADRIAAEARADRIAAEARAQRMVAEAHAYEISIAGVMSHLNQVPEVVSDDDFYVRCAHLLMKYSTAREMYAAVKDMRDKLLVFLRHECYGHK